MRNSYRWILATDGRNRKQHGGAPAFNKGGLELFTKPDRYHAMVQMGHRHIRIHTLQPKYPDLLKEKIKQKEGMCQRLKDTEIWDSALSSERQEPEQGMETRRTIYLRIST